MPIRNGFLETVLQRIVGLRRRSKVTVKSSQQSVRSSTYPSSASMVLRDEAVRPDTSQSLGRTFLLRGTSKGRGRLPSRFETASMVQLSKLRIEDSQNRGVSIPSEKLPVSASRRQISAAIPLRDHLSGSTRVVQDLLDPRTRDKASRTTKHLHRWKSASRLQQGRPVR